MRYIVALDFDYFDGDFYFGGPDAEPLLAGMEEDALSEGYVREFRSYDAAATFAKDVVTRICDRAATDGDESKEGFISRIRSGMLAEMVELTASEYHVTFDLGHEWGNWSIRLRLLSKGDKHTGWGYPLVI